MEVLLGWTAIAALIFGLVIYFKRRKSRKGPEDNVEEVASTSPSVTTTGEYSNDYRLLEVNKSRSSDRQYVLLEHLKSGYISCSCPGFTNRPGSGCVHTTQYIAKNITDRNGNSLMLGGSLSQNVGKGFMTGEPKTRERTARQKATLETLFEWSDSNYVVLDTETTGLSGRSKIIEIAVIDRHGEVLFDTLVNPGRTPIQAAATEIHGITRDDVRNKPSFNALWPELYSVLEKYDLILAYNADFDFRLIAQSLEDDDSISSLERLPRGCIMEAYTDWWRQRNQGNSSSSYFSLKDAAEQCEVKAQNDTHRAAADCEVARQVLTHMMQELTAKQ